MIFDTLKVSKQLQESFTPAQAETLARVLADAGTDQLATKADVEALEVSTKSDIKALELSTKSDIKALEADIKALEVSTKSDIKALEVSIKALEASTRTDFAALKAELKADIAALDVRIGQQISLLRADTIKWIVGAIAFNIAATAGVMIGLIKALIH